MPWLFGWSYLLENPDFNKTFDVALHVGTLIGALIYFRKDVARYIVAFFGTLKRRAIASPEERLAWALVIGTIPGALAGAAFEDVITEKLGQPWLIALALAAFGIVLWAVDKKASVRKEFSDIGPRDGGMLGIAQALALQPGVSRSGITITAGRLFGLNREDAARFSFLLALPIIFGAGLTKGIHLAKTGIPSDMVAPFFWGFVASALSGFLSIWGLLAYLRRKNFTVFMVYRLAVAAVVLAVILTGFRAATI